MEQLHQFALNCIELRAPSGPVIYLSQTAYSSLEETQIATLSKYAALRPVDVSAIERIGGGSVRCMIAENFFV
jgi:hypothetical protein